MTSEDGWRILARDELIQEGDEYKWNGASKWCPTSVSGVKPNEQAVYRRRVTPSESDQVSTNKAEQPVENLMMEALAQIESDLERSWIHAVRAAKASRYSGLENEGFSFRDLVIDLSVELEVIKTHREALTRQSGQSGGERW